MFILAPTLSSHGNPNKRLNWPQVCIVSTQIKMLYTLIWKVMYDSTREAVPLVVFIIRPLRLSAWNPIVLCIGADIKDSLGSSSTIERIIVYISNLYLKLVSRENGSIK